MQGSTGNMYIDGAYFSGGADYAEMFETTNGNPIEPGLLVTDDKVKPANSEGDYIRHCYPINDYGLS
ncbi:hypothetical protein J2S17_004220 [Cytobacillus purgationiresistens]|uniref:Peptidase G2 IMC autoproteolytic cleavage domain-containing protein n=1 Tax=Cytobacillus purgationiresistens TaxID=863449 RepID=A0ABU0APM4_9BACI|nr:hypothetical protein [Cytobacillus purgationiresistens]